MTKSILDCFSILYYNLGEGKYIIYKYENKWYVGMIQSLDFVKKLVLFTDINFLLFEGKISEGYKINPGLFMDLMTLIFRYSEISELEHIINSTYNV